MSTPLLHAAGNYFATPDGTAVYLAGNHTWTNEQNLGSTAFDFNSYLTLLQSEGANFARLWHWESVVPDGGGVSPLPYVQTGGRFDLTQFNQVYFDRLRSEVQAAGAAGIYVSIMLFQGWSVESNGSTNYPWLTNPFNVANNINGVNGDPNNTGTGVYTQTLGSSSILALQEAYVQKVIQTLGDLPNVLYEVANETASTLAALAWQNTIADYIHTTEASGGYLSHPVGITAPSFPGTLDPVTENAALLSDTHADWISPINGIYTSNPPDAPTNKVVIADTDHIFGIGGDINWVWQSFTRGYNVAIMDDLTGTGIAGTLTIATSSQIASETSERLGITETRQVSTMVNLTGMLQPMP